jgi:hypothetical protein
MAGQGSTTSSEFRRDKRIVLDPGKGVCTDPRSGDANLGVGGPGPPMQLSPDRGREKT